jgi:hypothetical protein
MVMLQQPTGSSMPERTSMGLRGIGQSTQGNASLVQGLEGLLTNTISMQQETAKVTKEMLVQAERTATFMGNVIDRAGAIAGISAFSASAPALMGAPGSPQEGIGHGATASSQPPQPVAGSAPGTTAPSDAPAPVDGRMSPSDPALTRGPGSGVTEGGIAHGGAARAAPGSGHGFGLPTTWAAGKRFSLGDLRQGVARNVSEHISEWGTSQSQQYNILDAQGKVQSTGFRNVPSGSPELVEGVGEMPSAGWRAEAVGGVKNFAGSMAEGAGPGEAIASAAPAAGAALGVAGIAYTAVNKGLDYAESQRQQNQRFQEVLGGSNTEGFGERWRQTAFRYANRGFVGGATSDAIYKAALDNYGTNRDMRGAYQESALGLVGAGVSGGDATRYLNEAAQAGNKDLFAFADALKAVSDAARDAGVSAKEARDLFAQNYQTTTAYAGGVAGTAIAQTQTAFSLAAGETGRGIDYSGIDSTLNRHRQASMLNMDYPTFAAKIATDTVNGPTLAAKGQTLLLQKAWQGIDPGAITEAQAMLQQRQRANGGQSLSEDEFNEVAGQIQSRYGIQPAYAIGLLKQVGITNVTEDQAVPQLLRLALDDQFNPALQNAKKERQYYGTDARKGGVAAADKAMGSASQGPQAKGLSRLMNERPDPLDPFHSGGLPGLLGIGNHERNWRGDLRGEVEQQAKKGNYSPIAAELAKNYGQFVGSDFKVETKDGARYVNVVDLVKDYQDQLQSDASKITISGGEHSGQSVGDVLGVHADPSVKPKSATQSAKSGSKKGKSDPGDGGGRIVVSAQPWLQRLLQFDTTGNAYMENADNNLPAPNSATVPPGQR